MRTSHFLLGTLRETPTDAEVISHQLMLRAGMIRKLASGLYTWMPTGLRVLRKVEAIVREEMDRSGAQEVLMPVVQPAELWEESTRWEQYGPELLRINDRHNRDFCLGPTHEEVITDLVRQQVQSYKQLPMNLYQIQTKFRDEIRPRFGVMRAREFIMKDAYSFHVDQASLQETYDVMFDTYCNIFTRIGVDFRPVLADTGSIGGHSSHEFHVLADSGEDDIAFSDSSDYAANVELAEAICQAERGPASQDLTLVDTPEQRTIEEVAQHLQVHAEQCVKTLIVRGHVEPDEDGNTGDAPLVAVVVRGDHTLNDIKACKHALVAEPFSFAEESEVETKLGCPVGFIGPVNLPEDIPVLVDRSAAALSDFVCGANEAKRHYTGANWERDGRITETCDLREVVAGDPSPDGQGQLEIKRGIEVGHIFQLGTKYSEAMKTTVLGDNGKPVTVTMGCYGIGVSRIVASCIEQNNDDSGIIWPDAIAPWHIAIVPMNIHKSERVREAADALYRELSEAGYDVLLDDRNERPGVKFSDIELIGIPHRLVLNDKLLEQQLIEYKGRTDSEATKLNREDLTALLKNKVQR